MRTVQGVREIAASPAEVYARLAAFESTAEWDPGVVDARRLDPGEPAVGTRFAVTASFMGRRVPMAYTLLASEPPHRLALVGTAAGSRAWDTITLEPTADGTRVTWKLDLQMLGIGRLLEPLLGPVLDRLADAALDGLVSDFAQA